MHKLLLVVSSIKSRILLLRKVVLLMHLLAWIVVLRVILLLLHLKHFLLLSLLLIMIKIIQQPGIMFELPEDLKCLEPEMHWDALAVPGIRHGFILIITFNYFEINKNGLWRCLKELLGISLTNIHLILNIPVHLFF